MNPRNRGILALLIIASVIGAVVFTAYSFKYTLGIPGSTGYTIQSCSSNPTGPSTNQIVFDPCVTNFGFTQASSQLASGNTQTGTSFKYQGFSPDSTGSYCQSILGGSCVSSGLGATSNPSTFGDTSVFTPTGLAEYQFKVTDALSDSNTYEVRLASDIQSQTSTSGGCANAYYPSTICAPTSKYGTSIGQSGSPVLVNGTSAEGKQLPTCCGTGSGQFPVAPYYPDASQNLTLTPGGYCVPGTTSGTVCNPYMIVQNFVSSQKVYFTCSGTATTGPCKNQLPGNYTATQTSTTQSAWYVGRWYYLITFQSPGCPTDGSTCSAVSLNCIGFTPGPITNGGNGCANPQNFFGTAENSNFQSQVQSGVTAFLNKVSLLSAANLGMGIFIPASWINSNTDWFGIYGVWLGLNSNVGLGSCTTSTCTAGILDHAPLGTWTDVGLTKGGFPTFSQFAPNLAQYSSLNLSKIIPTNLPNQVYTKFPILSFGTTFRVDSTTLGSCTSPLIGPTTCTGSCTWANLNGCWRGTSAAQWRQPVIFDTLGSKTTFGFTYTGVQPVQIFGATFSGSVFDGSNLNCMIPLINLFFKCPPPLGGVTATDGNSVGQSGTDGKFALIGLLQGTQTVTFTFNGYYTGTQTIICGSSGVCSPNGITVTMVSTTQVGTICIINPTQNAGLQTSPGFGCQPIWLVVFEGVLILAAILGVATILSRLAASKVPSINVGSPR